MQYRMIWPCANLTQYRMIWPSQTHPRPNWYRAIDLCCRPGLESGPKNRLYATRLHMPRKANVNLIVLLLNHSACCYWPALHMPGHITFLNMCYLLTIRSILLTTFYTRLTTQFLLSQLGSSCSPTMLNILLVIMYSRSQSLLL